MTTAEHLVKVDGYRGRAAQPFAQLATDSTLNGFASMAAAQNLAAIRDDGIRNLTMETFGRGSPNEQSRSCSAGTGDLHGRRLI
ncbi:hypothetical protein [Streptomyces sp. NPDC003710]